MKRLLWSALALAAVLAPVAYAQTGRYMGNVWNKSCDGVCSGTTYKTEVPNVVGPWGQPVEMKMPYAAAPPTGEAMARAMMSQSVPLELAGPLQQAGGGLVPAQYQCGPGGCGPGGMPGLGAPPGMGGMGGPGMNLAPGYTFPQQGLPPGARMSAGPLGGPGAVAAVGALTGMGGMGGMGPGGPGGPGGPFQASRTQVRFVGPTGMRISWFAPSPTGGAFTAEYLEAPGRYNFVQAAIYRLKLTNLPNRTNLAALYPTLEVVPATAKTATFLAHSSVPIAFTEEDIEQVIAGNFLVKVIYLPDPQFQDLAATGPDEVVSTRLEPGVDPIAEACRRGSILAIVRLGNSDLEAPNTPAMDAPPPGYGPRPGMPGAGGPGGPGGPGGGPGGPAGHGPGGMVPGMGPGGMPPGGMPGLPGIPGLPPRPQQPISMGNPGPSLVPSFPAAQGPLGPSGQPYLAPSPIPGLPQAVQGSGPPPVTAPQQNAPAIPVVPNKTTSLPGMPSSITAAAGSR
jgi:hypothetical protein